ncbi:hypothetical protein HYE68_005068 [Fusarium pseudograminearum]|nr:hypothetical protein HYE68_005068 [Fusarium pseudograminearum]
MSSRPKRPRSTGPNPTSKRQQTTQIAATRDGVALKIAKELLQARPPPEQIDLDIMPGFGMSHELSQDNEAEAMQLFVESAEWESIDAFDEFAAASQDFKTLWKTSVRVLHMPPNCMLAPQNLLQYGTGTSISDKVVFGSDFSKLLTSLIIHPVWGHEFGMFRLALQFAVKCRIGHRGVWPEKEHHARGYQAIETLRHMLDQSRDGPETISDMLAKAIGDTEIAQDFPAFLLTISDHVKKEDGHDLESYTQCHGLFAFPVLIEDLRAIERALDNYPWVEKSWMTTTARIWAAFKSELGNDKVEFPEPGQLKEYLSRNVEYVFRVIFSRKKQNKDRKGPDARLSQSLPGEQERKAMDDRICRLERGYAELASRFDQDRLRNAELLKRVEALESESLSSTRSSNDSQLRTENELLNGQLERVREERDTVKDQLREEARIRLENLTQARDQLSKAHDEIDSLESEKGNSQVELESLRNTNVELTKELSDVKQGCNNAQKNLIEATQGWSETLKDLSEARQKIASLERGQGRI